MLSYFYLLTTNSLLVTMGDGFKYSLLTVYIIEILITLVVLPFLIRLSGQLFIQTLKSYETIKNASDPEEHRPYYEHYRIMFCLLFVMLMTSVLNLIKAFYLIKSLFTYYVEPISLNLVINFWCSFQDAIISFGLLVMLQIIYFFQKQKVNLGSYFTLPVVRFFWILLVESGLLIHLILLEICQTQNDEFLIIFILPGYLLRFVLTFRFAKEGNDLVNKLITGILSNNDLSNAMGHERVENIYRATVIFRCLSWGNFILAILFCIPPLVEFIYYFLQVYLPSEKIDPAIFFSSVLFNELIFFFASILYAIFFLILWKFLFDRSKKVRFRGYSHFSESRISQITETIPILNPITFTGMKSQKILLRYYSIVISCITVIMVGFTTPLGVNGWSSLLFVHSGDYYKLKYTNIYKAMESCSEVTAEIYSTPYFSLDCNSTYFATIGDTSTPLYQQYSIRSKYSSKGENILWVPPNTTIMGLNNISSLNISFIVEMEVPCLIPFEKTFALEERFVIFDCVIPKYNDSKFIANCSNSNQCQSFHETILNKSSLIDISVHSPFEVRSPTYFLLKQTYNLSNLSNVRPVMDFWNSESEFAWQKYDILINNETSRDLGDLYTSDTACPIKFSCTLHYAIGITVGLFTLISIPVYLMVSVILIHRH